MTLNCLSHYYHVCLIVFPIGKLVSCDALSLIMMEISERFSQLDMYTMDIEVVVSKPHQKV